MLEGCGVGLEEREPSAARRRRSTLPTALYSSHCKCSSRTLHAPLWTKYCIVGLMMYSSPVGSCD
jgi:hypothetical protein